ncbi:MAG: phosphonoacetaldehyde hydrolase [Planctomycetota bacterium]|nr:phosphonoacetaldehyde hydrolase [Planctomycetota bacterium]
MTKLKHLQGIVFDWAGTMIDHGSRAPAAVFQEIFRRQGIEITVEQARGPMGMAKREHIAAIAAMPEVDRDWHQRFGNPCSEAEIDAMYEQFLPLQKETLKNHGRLIPGAAEAAALCRELGLKVGSSTGYTRELMVEVSATAREQGYEPDFALGAEDAPRGRPAPFLLFESARRMDVYPMSRIVKVDDTTLGIEAGVNAGCWNIGITRTGNLLGLSEEETRQLPEGELAQRLVPIREKMIEAGAHLTLESVEEIEGALRQIDQWMDQGKTPAG